MHGSEEALAVSKAFLGRVGNHLGRSPLAGLPDGFLGQQVWRPCKPFALGNSDTAVTQEDRHAPLVCMRLALEDLLANPNLDVEPYDNASHSTLRSTLALALFATG